MTNPNVMTNSNNVKIADVLTFVPAYERNKIITKLYDGSYQTQTIGTPTQYATVELFIFREEMQLLNQAEATNELVRIDYNGSIFYGYIEEPPSWDPIIAGHAYRGTVKFLFEIEG